MTALGALADGGDGSGTVGAALLGELCRGGLEPGAAMPAAAAAGGVGAAPPPRGRFVGGASRVRRRSSPRCS